MSAAVPIIRNDGEGDRLWFYGGGVHTWKASAEETAGAFILFEDSMTQGKTTPLHVHTNEDEALYVLDGELLVHIDGTDHRVGPRGVAVAPRGVAHAFLVTSPTARVLTLQTPGTAESFYRGASEPARAETDPSGPVDFRRVSEAAERSGGMKVLGPPPFPAEADSKKGPTVAGG
jgi:mannose-6-phosphate isomerase-like protein (cupin superfamily)